MLSNKLKVLRGTASVADIGDLPPEDLAPDTGKPFSKSVTMRYLIAFTAFAILNTASFNVNTSVLLPQHIKDVGIANPTAALGAINSIVSFVSLIAGFVAGALSDQTRSKFGRRTPWIFWACLFTGAGMYLVGSFATTLSITITYCLMIVGQNALQTPMYAVLADRCPQGIRGTLASGFGATVIGGPIGQMIASLFLGKSYQASGFFVGAGLMIFSGLIPLLLIPREASNKDVPVVRNEDTSIVKNILETFTPPKFSTAHDFYKALTGRFFMMMSGQLIANYQLYIIESWIGQTVQQAAKTIALLSSISLVVAIIGTFISGPLSDLLKRRKIIVAFAAILNAIGFICPLIFRDTMGMALFAGFSGLGGGAYGAVDQALNTDVLPDKENSGKNLGFLNVSTTFAFTLAPLITSMIVTLTGTYEWVFITSVCGAIIGVFFIMMIKKVR